MFRSITLAITKMHNILLLLTLFTTMCGSIIAFSVQHSSPFEKDFYEMNLNQSIVSCASSSSSSSNVEIFRPERATFTIRFKSNVISPSSTLNLLNPIFRMDSLTGVLHMNLDQVFGNTTTSSNSRYFVLKLTAYDQSNSNEWQTVLAVRISESLAKQCEETERRRFRSQDASSATTRNRKRTNRPVTYARLKLLFADSFQSYDFNKLYHSRTNNDADRSHNNNNNNVVAVEEEAIYLSEDLVKDSFICYVLVQSNLDIKLVGPDSATFKLERVHSGSTALLASDNDNNNNDGDDELSIDASDSSVDASMVNSIRPVINLYMLKLDKGLDRESEPLYRLDIVLFKETDSPDILLEQRRLNVIVTDVNDNEPRFENQLYKFEVTEQANNNNYTHSIDNTTNNNGSKSSLIMVEKHILGRVKAFDRDLEENATVEYYFLADSLVSYNSTGGAQSGRDPNKLIELDAKSGELCLRSSLDREEHFKHQFEVCARDSGARVRLVSKPCARVELTVLDLNDNRPQFYLLYDDEPSDNNNTKSRPQRRLPLDFYVEENCTENTFVAWLKAFDADAAENASLTYTLEPIDHSSWSPFWIDPHGIVRNSRRIRLVDVDEDEPNEIKSNPSLKSVVFSTRQRSFLVKITASDSSKDPKNRLSSSIELNLRILKKSDKNERSVRISTLQNETIFYINRRQQHLISSSSSSYKNASIEPITRILVNEMSTTSTTTTASNQSSTDGLYSFQMIPLIESAFEYGENCSQSDIIKYFRLNRQGEIFLTNYLLNASMGGVTSSSSSSSQQLNAHMRARSKSNAAGPGGNHNLLSLNMICFVNIRVLDLRNPFKLTTSKELVFIIYDIDNESLNDLIKLKFLKKINFIKSKHLQLSKATGGSSISALRNLYNAKNNLLASSGEASASSPIYSISAISSGAAASFNYSEDEMRKLASFALDKLNQSSSLLAAAAAVVPPQNLKTSISSLFSGNSFSSSSSSSSYSIFLLICMVISLSAFGVFVGLRVFTSLSSKRQQRSALNVLLSRLSQASAAKLDSQATTTATTSAVVSVTTAATMPVANKTHTDHPPPNKTTTTARRRDQRERVSFKSLLKDLNTFRIKHFTIAIPSLRCSLNGVMGGVGGERGLNEKQQQKGRASQLPSGSSGSSSMSSSNCSGASQFRQISENKYMNSYLIKNELLTSEPDDGIYKGPMLAERKWLSDDVDCSRSTTESLSNIYSNVNVKIKAAAAAAAASVAATRSSAKRCNGNGGGGCSGDDDTTGKDALSTSVALEHSKQPTNNGGTNTSDTSTTGIYSIPCFSSSNSNNNNNYNNKSSSVMATVNSGSSQRSQITAGGDGGAVGGAKLYLNESANTFINKSISVAASGRKMSYGIYQVANQVLIDYDDDCDGGGGDARRRVVVMPASPDDDDDDDDENDEDNEANTDDYLDEELPNEIKNTSSSSSASSSLSSKPSSVLNDELNACSIKSSSSKIPNPNKRNHPFFDDDSKKATTNPVAKSTSAAGVKTAHIMTTSMPAIVNNPRDTSSKLKIKQNSRLQSTQQQKQQQQQNLRSASMTAQTVDYAQKSSNVPITVVEQNTNDYQYQIHTPKRTYFSSFV